MFKVNDNFYFFARKFKHEKNLIYLFNFFTFSNTNNFGMKCIVKLFVISYKNTILGLERGDKFFSFCSEL